MLNPFKWLRQLFHVPKKFIRSVYQKIKKSLRMQLILTFAICFSLAGLSGAIYSALTYHYTKTPYIDYNEDMTRMDERTRLLADELDGNPSISVEEKIQTQAKVDSIHYLIVNIDGKVLYKEKNISETQLDIHSIIQNAMKIRNQMANERVNGKEFISFYPITIKEGNVYLIGKGVPEGNIRYHQNMSIMPLIIGVIVFFFLFFYITKRKMNQILELSMGLQEMAKGNLLFRVPERSQDELGQLASNINGMAEKLQQKIEDERRAEKLKNELITNVSHDLRTPLTSIMGYLRLIKDHKFETQQQMEEYLHIASGKSEQLKLLIDDLFDYTKLSHRGVRLNRDNVCLNELISQLIEELVPMAEENQVIITQHFPEEWVMVYVDPNQMVRVFENLLTNAIRYCQKPGEIRIGMEVANQKVTVYVENKGEPISSEDLDRLFDRFYKGDPARTSGVGGSGLGLAIAKSIVELHDGEIWAECKENQIRFLVQMPIMP